MILLIRTPSGLPMRDSLSIVDQIALRCHLYPRRCKRRTISIRTALPRIEVMSRRSSLKEPQQQKTNACVLHFTFLTSSVPGGSCPPGYSLSISR